MARSKFYLTLLALFALTGCETQHFEVVTTLYPHYDIVNQISGNKINVKLLLKPGSEAHDFEPTSKDYIAIENADLFIYTSETFDSNFLSEKIIKSEKSLNVEKAIAHNHDEEDNHDHDHNHGSHYWTNPYTFVEMIDVIYERISKLHPEENEYEINKDVYKNQILNTSDAFKTFLSTQTNKEIFFAGHNAMAPFANAFGLKITAISETFKPDADIISSQLITLIEAIKENNAKYLFVEELVDPKVALKIQHELGSGYDLKILELHGAHNLSKEDFDNNVSYLDLLNRNIKNLKEALQ